MPDIMKSQPTTMGSQVQQALSMGAGTPGFGSKVSQAVTPGQELLGTFQKYHKQQEQATALKSAQEKTKLAKDLMSKQKGTFDLAMDNQRRMAKLGSDAKNELLDMELQFNKDAAGNKYLSDRQILDWYATRARSEEEWKDLEQNMKQQYMRKAELMKAVKAKIIQAEKQAYARGAQALDQETRKYIAEAKANADRKAREAANKAANSAAIIGAMTTIGSVAGGLAGSFLMPGGGTAAGAAAGGALGTVLGGAAGTALGKWGTESQGRFTL